MHVLIPILFINRNDGFICVRPIFSIFDILQNALKKHSSSSSGGEHVVYAEPPAHGSSSGWQRSFPRPKTYGSHEFDFKGSYVDELH